MNSGAARYLAVPSQLFEKFEYLVTGSKRRAASSIHRRASSPAASQGIDSLMQRHLLSACIVVFDQGKRIAPWA